IIIMSNITLDITRAAAAPTPPAPPTELIPPSAMTLLLSSIAWERRGEHRAGTEGSRRRSTPAPSSFHSRQAAHVHALLLRRQWALHDTPPLCMGSPNGSAPIAA